MHSYQMIENEVHVRIKTLFQITIEYASNYILVCLKAIF